MIHHQIEQGTEEWFQLRMGKFTASKFGNLFAGKTTAKYNEPIYQAVYERLTGERPDDFKSAYMERGNELEAEALGVYSDLTFTPVQAGGFCELDDWVGGSPDGLIGEDGMVQVKCPKFSTMIKYMQDQELPKEYLHQVQGEMLVSGRQWSDFMAYHPKLTPVIVRIKRDEEVIKAIQTELIEAKIAANKILKALK